MHCMDSVRARSRLPLPLALIGRERAWGRGFFHEAPRGSARVGPLFFPGHSGAWCAPPACRVPLHFCALPLARRHLSLPSLAGRLARRGVGVAPEFKRTAAVGGEVTACFEPSRHGRSAAGSGLDFAAQAALREAGGEAWLLRWQALRCVSSRAAKGTLEDRTTR